ncbi:hypothetical protein F5141DRAFT_1067946 [Pisolithus sp. B1]|nr:hypothetical protein F5141DRAFT_1067946 [Pisolithus sp. B1]
MAFQPTPVYLWVNILWGREKYQTIVLKATSFLRSGDHPDFLGPWFSGYHTQIVDNGSNGSVLLHDSVPSPIAGPFNGAEGNFLLVHPNLLGVHPEHRYSGDGSNTVINAISLPPPLGFPSDALQNPTPSQVPAGDRWPCGWRGEHGDTCNVLIGYRCEAHLASAHGIVGMPRTRTVECGRCGKRIGRRSILQHYREKHLGFHRQRKGVVFHDTRK